MLGYGAECGWFYPSFYQPNSKQVPVLCQVLGWRCLVMVQNVAGSIHLSINPTVNGYLYYVKCLVGDAWLWCRMLLGPSFYQPNSKRVPVLCQVLGWRCLVMVQNPTVNKYLYYVKCLVGDAWLWCRMLLVLSIFLSTQQ